MPRFKMRVVFHSYFNIRRKNGAFDLLLTDPGDNYLASGPTRLPKSAARFKGLFELGN